MMDNSFAVVGASWLLTYAVHSSLLLCGAWILTRFVDFSYNTQETLWKAAMVSGILTAGVHVASGGGLGKSYALGQPMETPVERSVDMVASDFTPMADVETEPTLVDEREPVAPANPASIEPTASSAFTTSTPTVELPAAPTATTGRSVDWLTVVSVLWLLGVGYTLVRFLRARWQLWKLLRNRRPVQDPFLLNELRELQAAAGVDRTIRLTWSPNLVAPVALGREICIPKRALTNLKPSLRSGMLAHEVAHIARRDSTWLQLTFALRFAMFFQPLNRIAYRRLQELAEFLCDEWAVRQTGRRTAVAECLAEVAQWIDRSGRPIPLPSMAYDGSNLVDRVERILSGQEDRQMLPRSLKIAGVAGAVIAFGAAAPGFAPHREAPAVPTPAADEVEAAPVVADLTPATPDAPAPSVARDEEPPTLVATDVADQPVTVLMDFEQQATQDSVDPRVVASLLQVLRDPDPEVRREAAEALGRLRATRAVPDLIRTLGDSSTAVRAYSAWALGRIRDMRGMDPVLAAMVQDDSARVRRAAADAVDNLMSDREPGTMNVQAIGARFAQALGDDDHDVRASAISGLRDLRLAQYSPQIARLLSDPNPSVRRSAASALGRLQAPSGLASLSTALNDSSASVRRSVLSAISRYDTPEATAAARRAMTDESEDVREAAIRIIGERRDSSSFNALMTATQDASADVRQAALRALRSLKMPRAVAAYERALNDVSRSVRAEAISGLGDMRDSSALPALRRAASDSSASIRNRAVRALHSLGDTLATPVFVSALSDVDADVRDRAARALGDIRTSRGLTALRGAMRDTIAEVRTRVLRSIAEYEDPATADMFIAALGDSHDPVRQYAAQALGNLKVTRATSALAEVVRSDSNSEVRKRALRSLSSIGGDGVLNHVVTALNDGSSEVRVIAANILGQMRDARAVDPLMRALEDESSDVRRAATRALGRIQRD